MKAQSSLEGAQSIIMLYAIACYDLHMSILHLDREMNDDLIHRLRQNLADVIVKWDDVFGFLQLFQNMVIKIGLFLKSPVIAATPHSAFRLRKGTHIFQLTMSAYSRKFEPLLESRLPGFVVQELPFFPCIERV